MLTDDDIQKMLTAFTPVFATKDDLGNLKHEVNEEINEFKSGVYTRVDKVYKELVDMRQEQSVHSRQHEDIDDKFNEIKSASLVTHSLKK